MQWYNRTPVKTPAMKITTAVVTTAIPTATPVLRESTAPAWGTLFIDHWCNQPCIVWFCKLRKMKGSVCNKKWNSAWLFLTLSQNYGESSVAPA